jgi:hypothetical protein
VSPPTARPGELLCTIPGVKASAATEIQAEIAADMSVFHSDGLCRSRSGVGRITPPRGSTREARRPNGASPGCRPRLTRKPAGAARCSRSEVAE